MAKSQEISAPDPVNESETEESETELSDSDSDPEPEPEPEQVRKAPAAKPLKPADSSSSSEESEYDSDSDSKLDSPPTKVKQLPSSSAAAKKAPALASPTTRPTTGTKKRSSTLSRMQDTKPSKKTKSAIEGKKLFERVFAREDEIIILEELLKRYPSPQMDDLLEAVKSRISVPVTKAQVVAKIRRLRTKFFNKKGSRNVEEDEHEMLVNQLSQNIWGSEEEEGPKSVVKTTKIALRFEEAMAKDEEAMGKDEKKKDVSYAPNGVGGSVDEWVFGEGTGLLPEEARSELEKKWKSIRREEARLSMEKHELSLQQAKMVYDAMNP